MVLLEFLINWVFKVGVKMSLVARNLILFSLIATIAVSCTKKRDAKFAFGVGEDLLVVKDYDNKEFWLQTNKEQKQEIATTSSESKSTDTPEFESLGIIEYTSNSDLMKDVPFIGAKDRKYRLIYELTPHYLKIFKLVSATEVSLQEESMAEDFSGSADLKKIPIVGYPITGYYQILKNKNESGEETSQLIEKRKDSKEAATHFRIDKQNRELFSALQQTDLFPASFFDGDWYYGGTIVATNYMSQSWYGIDISQDLFGNEAGKVRLQKSEEGLNFVNLNIDPKLQKTMQNRSENQINVISIPGEWLSIKTSERGSDKGLRQEVDQKVPWNQAKFVRLNFKGANSVLSLNGQSSLKDLQLSRDFFSFVLTDADSKMQVRHSFLRAKERNYEPKTYFKSDEKKFGFFFSQRASISGPDKANESDFESDYFVNRFNPKNKKIVFHLSKGSPSWTENMAREAISEWNNTFKPMGMEITLSTERKNLGDIRYNIINMISQPDTTFRWGGYGPTLTDPTTGEIIAATTNLPVTMYVNGSLSMIRRMADHAQGLLSKSYIQGEEYPANEIYSTIRASGTGNPDSIDAKLTLKNNIGLLNIERVLQLSKGTPHVLKFPDLRSGIKKSQPIQMNLDTSLSGTKIKKIQNQPEFDLVKTHGNIFDDVNAMCPEVKKYIENLKPDSQRSSSQDEFKLFMPCAIKVSQFSIVSALLHELGHNFGLRHNFFGSVDVTDEEWNKGIRSSSIMDYLNGNSDMGRLGPYDKAAVRWAYADELQVQSDNNTESFVKLENPNRPIDENVTAQSLQRKPYLYCSDEHVDITNYDSLCARSDIGRNAKEIVENLIQQFNSSIAVNMRRLGRDRFIDAHTLVMHHLDDYFIPLKRHYDQWRFKLAEFAGKDAGYLETLDIQKYQELLNQMNRDEKFGPYLKAYKPAADLVLEFFMQMAFLPDKYCLIDRPMITAQKQFDKEGKEVQLSEGRLEPLEKIMTQVFHKTGKRITSCQDPAYTELLKKDNTVVNGEIGYFVNSIMKGISVNESVDSRKVFSHNRGNPIETEVNGMIYHRLFAMLMLTERFPTAYYNQYLGFYPNMLDEVHINKQLEALLLNRILTGIDIRSLTKKFGPVPDVLSEGDQIFISKNYANERLILGFQFDAFKWGQIVPTSREVTDKRLSRYFPMSVIGRSEIMDNLEGMGLRYEMAELIFNQPYFATEREDIAFHLMRTFKSLTQLRYSMSTEGPMVEAITNLLTKRLTDKDSIKNFTLTSHDELISSINVEAGNMIRSQSQNGLQLLRNLSMQWQIFDRALKLWMKESKLSEDESLKLKKAPISEIMTKVNEMIAKKNELLRQQDRMPLFKEEIYYSQVYKDQVKEILAKHELGHKVYLRDKDDYDSQYDLIKSLLLGGD